MPGDNPPKSSNDDFETKDVALAIARVVKAIGEPSLGRGVLEFLRTQAFFDSALMVIYHQKRQPRVLVESLAHPMRSNNVEAYLAGAYLLDPFRMHAQTLRGPAVVRLRDITCDDFRASEYFRSYYVGSHLIDEVNFLIPVANEQVVAICLGRSQSLAPFGDAEIDRFRNWLPMLDAVLQRHVAIPGATMDGCPSGFADREHARLEARLATFGATSLTPREHEVVQHLLRGTSAPAIAGRLSVSLQTVRVHRRNIYEKLGVSSLGQLFSLAMHSVLAGDG